MTIVKNEPIFTFQDGDYTRPRHIVVEGSHEEIGYDLGMLARETYGTKLGMYKDHVYAAARRDYLEHNWPEMLAQAEGVLRAYGLPEDDAVFDGTALPFDFYDMAKGGRLDFNTCSAVVLPHEKTDTGATYVSRNFDLMAMVLWSELQGKAPPAGAYRCWERGVVIQKRPDTGHHSILVGGQELLSPYIDAINDKGLYISLFHDPSAVGDEGGAPSGGEISGVSMTQLVGLLMDRCATVAEAKRTILANRIMQTVMTAHAIIADASGDATIFEIDGGSEAYVFVDRAANEPLFITNHPCHTYPTPETYPDLEMSAEHNTFVRQILFRRTFEGLSAPLQRADATTLTDAVHCAFADDHKAEAAPKERTLINTNADLSKPEINVRWYLGDVGPVAGTNNIKTRMSEYHTFGF